MDRSIRRLGVLGAVLAALLIGVLAYGAGKLGPEAVPAYTTSYHYRVLDDPLELLIVQSDGQAFASLARDPSLARPEIFRTDGEAAYRAQRPLLGYLAWAGSLGQTGWVPPAMAVLAVFGTGLAVSGTARLLADRGAPPALALLIFLFAGTYMALSYFGPEPLGVGLVTWGLVAWDRKRVAAAVALFTLAALCRESLLVVPAALGFVALWRRQIRQALWLTPPLIAYLAWITVVRLRVGAWPTDAGPGRIDLPLRGMIDGLVNHVEGPTLQFAATSIALGLIGLVVSKNDPLRPVIALHLAFASTMGFYVWVDWVGFSRVLLAMDVLALVAIAGRVCRGRSAGTTAARDVPQDASMAGEVPAIVV